LILAILVFVEIDIVKRLFFRSHRLKINFIAQNTFSEIAENVKNVKEL
jgi:hypothetical protein